MTTRQDNDTTVHDGLIENNNDDVVPVVDGIARTMVVLLSTLTTMNKKIKIIHTITLVRYYYYHQHSSHPAGIQTAATLQMPEGSPPVTSNFSTTGSKNTGRESNCQQEYP